MADVAGSPEDLWTPFKVLQRAVKRTLRADSEPNLPQLAIILRKSKPFFENLLLNPPKNPHSRAQIRNGTAEGVNIPGMGNTILSQVMVDESLILSDMYDLNEFTALQLLCSAESQMPNYPGLSRALVAILLYYDGRRAVVDSLRDLFQLTRGLTWTADLLDEAVTLVSPFTTNLVQETNVLCRIVDLVDEMSLTREMALLTKNRVVGNAKHHMQVTQLFSDIKLSLATALFNWSAQRGLPKIVMGKLIQLLAKHDVTEQQHCMDDVLVTLLSAFLQSLDLSFLLRLKYENETARNFPLFCEDDYALYLHNIIEKKSNWCRNGRLKATCVLALGVCLSRLRQAPLHLRRNSADVIEKDEQLVVQAIDRNVFAFIRNHLLESKLIFSSAFMYRRLHVLFTDVVELMRSKIIIMGWRANATARTMLSFYQQGLDAPQTIDHNFENLMLSIAKFYAGNILDVEFCYDYWESDDPADQYQSMVPQRSLCLHKFMSFGEESQDNSLFVPYAKMLAGLSSSKKSAKHVFAWLQDVDIKLRSIQITWDNFFTCVRTYCKKLKFEATSHRNRVCISPPAIAGIQAVLEIIRAISDYDELCRMSFCQQPNWLVVQTFLELLGYTIPLYLKVDIFKTLASLGKSVETAKIIWESLERLQIISTIPSTSGNATGKIDIEIDKHESLNEAYPLTQAFLDFIYTLCSTATPKNLADTTQETDAGTRSPDLSPYLTFIIDKIFLVFYSRSYKNPREKWEIGEKCLNLLSFFVQSYDTSEDNGGAAGDQNTSPGYQVLIHMYTKSDTLKLILHILYEAREMLSTYSPFEGKVQLEACSLHCLMIIEKALNEQEAFIRLHAAPSQRRILPGLANLLMEINPRTGIPDHLISTTKFVVFAQWLPSHALTAIRILKYMSKKPNTVQHLLQLFLQYDEVNNEIRQAFVDCLQGGGVLEVAGKGIDYEMALMETIIKFLIETIHLPAPNLAHYFLGYHVTISMELTELQREWVVSKPTHCMKALIVLLDGKLELIKHNYDIEEVEERVYYQAFNLLYTLCLNRITSNFTLRLLRTNFFLVRHLAALPFPSINPSALEQMSFLLRCVAIELKASAQNNHISGFNNLFKLLTGVAQASSEETPIKITYIPSAPRAIPTAVTSSVSSQANQDRILLSALLNCVDFEAFTPNIQKWTYFDESLIKDALECHQTTYTGVKIISMQNLHAIVQKEFIFIKPALTATQRHLLIEEFKIIVSLVSTMNEQKQKMVATVKFVEAWCQVAETLFIVSPTIDTIALPVSMKQTLLLKISRSLLMKVNIAWNPELILRVDILPEVAILSADTLLMLLANAHLCYIEEKRIQDSNLPTAMASEEVLGYSLPNSQKSSVLSLKWILTNILEWMFHTAGMSSPHLIISLNASFLAFMHIINGNPKNLQISNPSNHFEFVYRLDASSAMDQNEEKEMTSAVLKSFGHRLRNTLNHDCTEDRALCKLLAASSISLAMQTDFYSEIIAHLSTMGHFNPFINDIQKSDQDLCRIVELGSGDCRELYIYQAKMGMLCKVASNPIVVEVMLAENILGVLSSMKVFDMHPYFRTNSAIRDTDRIKPNPADILYQQVLYPATSLCMTILTTLGPENQSAHAHVLHFLLSHMDTVEVILSGGLHCLHWDVLKELNTLTAIISTTAKQKYTALIQNGLPLDEASHLRRVQQRMLTLFSKFIVNEANVRELHKPENITYDFTERNRGAHVRCFLETASNLALYCRHSIANHSANHRTNEILFLPTVVEVPLSFRSTLAGRRDVSPSISVVVAQLKCTVDYYNRQRKVHDDLVHQRPSMQNVSPYNTARERFHELRLSDSISDIKEELRQCAFISEHCLYIFWAHLDSYVRKLIQQEVNRNAMLFENNNQSPFQRNDIFESSYESEWNITLEEISALKKSLISVFTETFCSQLLQVAQADRNNCEVLLQRIRTLISIS